jgi:hypothetical protein
MAEDNYSQSNARKRFRQRDVVRLVKAISVAGHSIARVDVKPDGTISVITADGSPTIQPIAGENEWDSVV